MTTIATTACGDVQGVLADGVLAFRNVPYAAPPVGPLRFQPPQPCPAWTGLRDGTRHGSIAPQMPSRLRVAMGDPSPRPTDEDCLNLSVWTPACDGGKRPVLVWLHGGAWTTGAASIDWYDGTHLARNGDLVVVGVNYRLGALGYLHLPGIAPGNMGTLDEIAALRWVRDNIAAFGGDPDQVTVAGQSAGASSIGRIILHPESRPGDRPGGRALFRRAILQSGGFGRTPLDAEGAAAIGRDYLRVLGIDPDAPDAGDALRALPVAALLDAQGALARSRARFADTNPAFMPSLEATPGTPKTEPQLLAAIADAAAEWPGGLELMIGATADECHAFFAASPDMQAPDPALVEELFARPEQDRRPLDWYRARRPGGSTMDLIADRGSNHTFTWPSMRLADAAAARGVPVHAYLFTWAAPNNRFRACHCIELPFVFGTFPAWEDAPMLAGGDPDGMRALSDAMQRSWISFVRDGNPAQPHLAWPHYTAQARATMLLGETWRVAGNAVGLDT